jgi:predicted dehydrogenase
MTVNVGVIGSGKIGQEHIRRLTETLPGAKVVAVSDADAARANEVAATVPGAKAYPTGEELIATKNVDSVIVTSWGDTHAAYVIAAIRAGKPVFCEKPMATTQADCLAILDAEAAFGRRLVQIGFMRRFDTQYRAMKETIRKGVIGFPLMFHSVHRNASSPGHFKATMAITDTAVHDIDIARFLLDDEPVAISVNAPRRNRNGESCRDERRHRQGERRLFRPRARRLAGTVRRRLRRRVPRLAFGGREGRRCGSERMGRLCRHRRHARRRQGARKQRARIDRIARKAGAVRVMRDSLSARCKGVAMP